MATATERLALLITADGGQAIRELDKLGASSKKNIGEAENRIGRLSSQLTTFGAGAVAAGATVASELYKAAESAQGLADSVDKADAVFGSSKSLERYAQTAANKMGMSKEAALDAASAYGALLKQSGVGGQALATASEALAQRTADLAERYKKPYEEVQKAIEATVKTGSAKALKNLLGIGVQIDPASLKGLDAAGKTIRVYQEILRQTQDSQGFFANSTDDIGVRFAQAQAKARNAVADFGTSALPILANVADAGSRLIDTFNDLPKPIRDSGGAIATIGSGAAIALGGVSVLLGQLLKLKELADAGGTLGTVASISGPLATAATAGFALQQVIDTGLSNAAENAAGSMADFQRSIPTKDMADLRDVTLQSLAVINQGPDTSNWQRLQRVIADTVGFRIGAGPGLLSSILGQQDDNQFKIEALQMMIDNFKSSLAGLDEATGRARINTFIDSLKGSGIDAEGLKRIQADLIKELDNTPPAANSAAAALDALGISSAAAGEKTETAAEKFRNAQSALSSVTSASDRLKNANENLAKLTQRDTKTIESAYQRMIDAKQRLDDVLNGDGTGLQQESPEAQAARARAKIAEANARLAANPKDAEAQTMKDEAITQLEAAQRRSSELAKNAKDTARQVRDANEAYQQAQKDYADSLAGPTKDEVDAAWKERADAELAQATAIADFAQGVQDGKIKVDAFGSYLDDLVKKGLISPESAQFFKDQMASLASAAGVAAGALAGIAQREGISAYAAGGGQPGTRRSPIDVNTLTRTIIDSLISPRSTGGGQGEWISAAQGRLRGLFVRDASKPITVADQTGNLWHWDPARQGWKNMGPAGRRASGGTVTGGRPYLVGENGPELMIPGGSGYVVNARQTANTLGRGGMGVTWNVTNHISGVRDPQATAATVVQKMRAKAFLRTGAGL